MKKIQVNQATALLTIATVLILAGCACDEMCGDHKDKPATQYLHRKQPKHATPAHQAPMQKACPAKAVKTTKYAPKKVVKKTSPQKHSYKKHDYKKHVAAQEQAVKPAAPQKVEKKDTKYAANTQTEYNQFGIEKELADLIG